MSEKESVTAGAANELRATPAKTGVCELLRQKRIARQKVIPTSHHGEGRPEG